MPNDLPEESETDKRYRIPPDKDEIEVTIIGPGFGETMVVHLGDNKWFAIDSCVTPSSDKPAPLHYLDEIDVKPENVFAIAVSHWDDDHCRGLAEFATKCINAEIILPPAFIEKDFLAFVAAHDKPLTSQMRAGVKEIRDLSRLIDKDERSVRFSTPARRLFGPSDITAGHGAPIEIWSLSPSDIEYRNFIAWAASQMPSVGETRRVAVKRIRNDLTSVIYFSVGDNVLLFGGDLEEEGDPATGWSAILSLRGRPNGRAGVFKVPHHGSKTAHHDDLPSILLDIDPIAIVAPFKNGNVSLPTEIDVKRILAFAPRSFTTATLTGRASPKRDPTVDKTIREVTKRFSTIKTQRGIVRLRKHIASTGEWRVEQYGSAGPLEKIFF